MKAVNNINSIIAPALVGKVIETRLFSCCVRTFAIPGLHGLLGSTPPNFLRLCPEKGIDVGVGPHFFIQVLHLFMHIWPIVNRIVR